MNLWNEKGLPLPPINTYKAEKTNIDIGHLQNVFKEGKAFFEDEKFMYVEHTVLSTVTYRMKQKFRSAKDFKALEKLDKALDNYFKMDILSNLKMFIDLIPSKYNHKVYLPTKNLLDYILVRLQGLVKLMERVVETSKIAAFLLEKRMHIGHFWKLSFILFSLVSRVYTLARYTTNFVCDFYRKLLPFSSQLQNTSATWLPDGYVLPKDLREWIAVDWLEFDDEVQIVEAPSKMSDIIKFFDLVDDENDDVQFCEEYFMIDDEDDTTALKYSKGKNNRKENSFIKILGELRGFDNKEDIGEIIKIEDSFQEASNIFNLNEHNENIADRLHNIEEYDKQPTSSNIVRQLFQSTPILPKDNTDVSRLVDASDTQDNSTATNISMIGTKREVEENPPNVRDDETEKKFRGVDKRNIDCDAVSISDSNSNISDGENREDSICVISDGTDDVIEIRDISAEKTKYKESIKRNQTEAQKDESIIIISDVSRLENKCNTPSLCSQESVIILDTPKKPFNNNLRRSKKEKKFQQSIKKVRQTKITGLKTKIKHFVNLNGDDATKELVSLTEKDNKKKINRNILNRKQKKRHNVGNHKDKENNETFIRTENINKRKEQNSYKLKTKQANKISKMPKQKFKTNSKKLKLALQSSLENGNLVTRNKNKIPARIPADKPALSKQQKTINGGGSEKITLPLNSLTTKKRKKSTKNKSNMLHKVKTKTFETLSKLNRPSLNTDLNATTKKKIPNNTKSIKSKSDKGQINTDNTLLQVKEVNNQDKPNIHAKQLKVKKKKKGKADNLFVAANGMYKKNCIKQKPKKTKTIKGKTDNNKTNVLSHEKNVNGQGKLNIHNAKLFNTLTKNAKKRKKVKKVGLNMIQSSTHPKGSYSKDNLQEKSGYATPEYPRSLRNVNRYFNNVQDQARLQNSDINPSILSNSLKKRKRYWENSNKIKESSTLFVGLNIGISKHKGGISTENYIPLKVSSGHNVSITVKQHNNSKKDRKKKR